MKKIFLNKIAVMMLALFLLASCQDLFNTSDIKSNPNAVTDVDIPTLLSGTLVGTAMLHEDTDVRIVSLWAGELAGLSRQHQGYAQYIVNSGVFSWGTLYPVASQARLIQTKADALGDKWSKGVGEVIEALLIAKATDLYGDVPYSQAFDVQKYPVPVFDKQADVYTALLATLNDAVANLSAPTGLPFAAGDFIFGGSVASWKGVANSLKARLYLHLQKYPEAIAAAQAGISGTDGDALIPHGTGQGVDDNQDYDFFKVTRKGDTGFADDVSNLTIAGVKSGLAAFLPVLMKTRIPSDPSFGGNTKTDETALYNFFFKKGIVTSNSLDPNIIDGAFAINAQFPVVTYYETQLILAEAYARQSSPDLNSSLAALNNVRAGLSGGYINGQKLSSTGLQYDPYVITDFNSGGVANASGLSPQIALLTEIITQKYILLLMQYEAFNDVRRLAKATPVVQLNVPLVAGTTPPERLIYPQTEISTNHNVPSPLPDQFTKLPIYQ